MYSNATEILQNFMILRKLTSELSAWHRLFCKLEHFAYICHSLSSFMTRRMDPRNTIHGTCGKSYFM